MDKWQIWIDTGGTFTDCIAVDPNGRFHKTKVLSSSALRGTIREWIDKDTIRVEERWGAPDNFIQDFEFHLLGTDLDPTSVSSFDAQSSVLKLRHPLPPTCVGYTFEVTSNQEAPILSARLITRTPSGFSLPPADLRLATTKGTNALLENNGAPTLLLVTEGFRDLLTIGDQKRPDLFALNIEKPSPLYRQVVEIPERMGSDGKPVRSLDIDTLRERLLNVENPRQTSVALCLLNSYKNAAHEMEVKELLQELGFTEISISSELSPFIKILPRAETTVVNAYLSPILKEYINNVDSALSSGSFRMMTSAGGLVQTGGFNPKDSLLSGPAGGVVGATTSGKEVGFKHIISFDMGGTSTDVARYDGEFDYRYQHTVGDARLAAPALAIETVAAGGGSICSYDGFKLTVGPESAGADPGPACYGAGGPLTLTDVNLLLGRLEPENFGIPVSIEASKSRLHAIFEQLQTQREESTTKREILEGFLQIANERMADAIRKISLRKGYDPREYAIVAFGGAGAQHACSIAEQLNIRNIVIPPDAGLLSAYGLGNAAIERINEKQILKPLKHFQDELDRQFNMLRDKAVNELFNEGIREDDIMIRRRSVFMRLEEQESTIEVNFDAEPGLTKAFEQAYRNRYGHWVSDRTIEVESIRIVASQQKPKLSQLSDIKTGPSDALTRYKKIIFNGQEVDTPVYNRKDLTPGSNLNGPALILDPYSTIVIEPGWSLETKENGSLILTRKEDKSKNITVNTDRSEAVALELFTNRFTSIAEEMGEMLQRTALSVNVKERMDYSCALLNARGELIVNAPHIPVHLGALGLCIRRLKESIDMQPGDVVVTNHPVFGGSHLPDVTVVTPIFTRDKEPTLIGYAANRAHHAEIGGTRPGSMPPGASTLAEEGVVIPPMHLIRQREEHWQDIEELLTVKAEYPTRSIEENLADLQAAVAANQRGVQSMLQLVSTYGQDRVLHYMNALKDYATDKMLTTLKELPKGMFETTEFLDDGTQLHATITISEQEITFDFDNTGPVHPGNLNATPAIVNSVIMYILRLLVDEPLPLNEGLLEPVSIRLPDDSILNPGFPNNPSQCPAVVGGNVETSQRLVDLLLKPFNRIACSQGTMNNVLFGSESFGYYETIGGGTGAGPDFDGSDAVHHHMTNTSGTDPEILEQRYPVRLDQYSVRTDSGGSGNHQGGNGIRREMTFLEPVSLSVLTQHRKEQPYGLKGGKPGARGKQWVIRKNGNRSDLESIDGAELESGDRFIILTPGGGGYGKINS